jgi:hypothetical protein
MDLNGSVDYQLAIKMPEISVTQALAELKLINKRLDKAFVRTKWIAVSTSTRPVDAETLRKNAQSEEQSYTDLIKRREALKRGVVQSNATTRVKIGEWEGTVAEAVERKTSIAYKTALLDEYRNAYNNAQEDLRMARDAAQSRLDRLLSSELGKDVRTNPETIAALTTTFNSNNKVELVDPLGLAERIKALEAEIDTFTTNVDWVLSESNGRTMIQI